MRWWWPSPPSVAMNNRGSSIDLASSCEPKHQSTARKSRQPALSSRENERAAASASLVARAGNNRGAGGRAAGRRALRRGSKFVNFVNLNDAPQQIRFPILAAAKNLTLPQVVAIRISP